MDSETIITWNAENWLTVFLMAFVGFMVLGLVGGLARKAFNMGGKVSQKATTDNIVDFTSYMGGAGNG